MERCTLWHWRLSSLHCVVLCVCVRVPINILSMFVCDHQPSIISIVAASQRLVSRHYSMSKRIKDDANKCRLAIMKRNYGFIRRCNCFVSASRFVLVVRRLLLPLYNTHAHPYLTCGVIWDTIVLLWLCEREELSFIVFIKWSSTGDGWFVVKCNEKAWWLWSVLLAVDICRRSTQTGSRHSTVDTVPAVQDAGCSLRRILQNYIYTVFSKMGGGSAPSAGNASKSRPVDWRISVCLSVCCNTTGLLTGWHGARRCEMIPLGTIVWLEHHSQIALDIIGEGTSWGGGDTARWRQKMETNDI